MVSVADALSAGPLIGLDTGKVTLLTGITFQNFFAKAFYGLKRILSSLRGVVAKGNTRFHRKSIRM